MLKAKPPHKSQSQFWLLSYPDHLFFQVFHLLSFLVKFGYFDDTYPIVEMIPPIMNVLDGRIDEPFRRQKDAHGDDVPLSEEDIVSLVQYRDGYRYRATPDHHHVVQAKRAGLEVLELIMEMQVTDRIKVRPGIRTKMQ